MAELPVRTKRVSWLIQLFVALVLYQEAGITEKNELLLRSSRTREVRDCHCDGREPFKLFMLRSMTFKAPIELQAAGRVLERLRKGQQNKAIWVPGRLSEKTGIMKNIKASARDLEHVTYSHQIKDSNHIRNHTE